MVYIQSATAEIRREKRRQKKIEETTGQKYNVDTHLSQRERTTRCQIKYCQLLHNCTKIAFERLATGK